MLKENKPHRIIACRGKVEHLQRVGRPSQTIALLDSTPDRYLESVIAIHAKSIGARRRNREDAGGLDHILVLISVNDEAEHGAIIPVVGRTSRIEVVHHQAVFREDRSLL